jgi:hypothetical protein
MDLGVIARVREDFLAGNDLAYYDPVGQSEPPNIGI